MARGEQLPVPGTIPPNEFEARKEKASEHLNVVVALVERLNVELRQARADERRARAALAAFYK